MKRNPTLLVGGLALFSAVALAGVQGAQINPKVGGVEMSSQKDIVDNAVASPVHKTLVAAVQAAGLVETLKGPGPFTVFAPTDAAFSQLPEGAVADLVKPENKAALTKVLTYHVVAGKFDSKAIKGLIEKGGGTASIKTVSGGTLTAQFNGPSNVVVVDESGNAASISTYDVNQSNGIIHVVDRVLLPR